MKNAILVASLILCLGHSHSARADASATFNVLVVPSIDDDLGFGTTPGVGGGVSLDLLRMGKGSFLQGHLDFSWQKWGNDHDSDYYQATETELGYTRMPIFAGARAILLFAGEARKEILAAFYFDGGVEVSFDTIYTNPPYVDDDTTDSSTNIGAAFGGGLLLRLGAMELTFGLRQHAIKDSYLAINALGLGLRFGSLFP